MGVMLWGRKWDQRTCLTEESKRREHRKRQEGAGRGRGQEGDGRVSKNHDSLFRKQSMDDNSLDRQTD